MCLAVPARLVTVRGNEAVADMHGNQVPISTVLVPYASVGDWVLVHAGFAIQQLQANEAAATFAVLDDLDAAAQAGSEPGADNGDESG